MTDVARLRRLQYAIRAAAEVDAEGDSGAEAIGAQYNALRAEVQEALPAGVIVEFSRLFLAVEVNIRGRTLSPEAHFAKLIS